MTAVNSAQRKLLETTIVDAREAAEAAARAALTRLAVDQETAFLAMSPDDRSLRKLLRAEARRLGSDGTVEKGFAPLVTEVAYQQWHQMLFARFLAENDLLLFEGTPVTLSDCEELAPDFNEPDAWAFASQCASAMLPGVFRVHDPALRIRFAINERQEMEKLLGTLPPAIFKADDSLGWVYQFWQAKAKTEVNASGRKVGGADISPVTQLFTEHYMVQFLLHNSLGAWWAGKHPNEELPTDLSYLRRDENGLPAAGAFSGWPGTAKELKILDPSCGSGHFLVAAFALMVRFRMAEEDLSAPEAGDAVLRDNLFGLELDPRCSQIAAFALALAAWKHGGYRPLPLPNVACSGIRLGGDIKDWARLAEKDGKLRAVLVQLRELFANAADLGSLIDPTTVGLQPARRAVNATFSVVAAEAGQGSLMEVAQNEREYAGEPLVEAERVLAKLSEAAERFGDDADELPIFGDAANEAVRAVKLLGEKYHLVITNVPYLGRGNQGEILRNFCAKHYAGTKEDRTQADAKADLATVFVRRCLQFCVSGGSTALVTPQNWLFLGSYASLRGYLLRQKTWNVVARLGPGAFETISGEVVNVGLFVLTNAAPKTGFVAGTEANPFLRPNRARQWLEDFFEKNANRFLSPPSDLFTERLHQFRNEMDEWPEAYPGERELCRNNVKAHEDELAQDEAHSATKFFGLDVSTPRIAREKDELLRTVPVQMVAQRAQLNNPDARISLDEHNGGELLERYAHGVHGLGTKDGPRFVRCFWEICDKGKDWEFMQGSTNETVLWGGMEHIVFWQEGEGILHELGRSGGAVLAGGIAWGKAGVSVNQMNRLPCTLFAGDLFYKDTAVVLPHEPKHLSPIWAFCSSPEYKEAVRKIDQSLAVTCNTLVKVPFDLARWQKIAEETYPHGLPEPHSDDPTQWLFSGDPARATTQSGDVLQVAVARLLGYRWPRQTGAEIPGVGLLPDDGLSEWADADGILCLPSVAGEQAADVRLRALLAAALGTGDAFAAIERLLLDAGYGGKTLEDYLRDGFFAAHLKRFHNRPFVWHIWDGRKDGFSALVNYHSLTRTKLEKLIYTYLLNWIKRQADDEKNDVPGANARLVEALKLQKQLESILHGEPPFDIFVRWKDAAHQPMGWEPDLNDGVRLNIRPFVEAGVLRVKKPSINWNKDRGTNPDGSPYGSERLNDLHLTLAEKRAARELRD